ncbi:MAG TPA: translation initiation factor IF-3 [Limnochordia bacterium]|nr:translation initiation factor IF-3 [Limnochordia bacterium]
MRRSPQPRAAARDTVRVNDQIRARLVRVISDTGEQLGIMSPRDAVQRAAEMKLDLVEVAPQASPPVCRIMDYGKYKYEQSKRDREARKKQKIVTVKELHMRPKIDDHDFDVKAKNAKRFLEDGDKVKVAVRFRGREIVHQDIARVKLQEMAGLLQEVGTIERPPQMEGRQMIMIISPPSQKS